MTGKKGEVCVRVCVCMCVRVLIVGCVASLGVVYQRDCVCVCLCVCVCVSVCFARFNA